MANFSIPYIIAGNYTFDNSKIEIDSGIAKLKKLTSDDETFYASYNTDINGSRGLGVLTGTPYGGASVSGGKLDLAHDDLRYVDYDAVGNADSQQTGCIRFKIIPNYSGIPTGDRWLFCITNANRDIKNMIELRHSKSGSFLRLHMYDKDGIFIVEHLCGQFSPIADTEYEIEVNWDLTSGATRLFVDGVQNGATYTGTAIRDSNIGLLRIGGNQQVGSSTYSNFKIDDFQVFNTVQHTANYTPESAPETKYSDDSPTIYKTLGDGVVNIEEWISFTETLESGNEGSVRYQLSGNGTDWLYWNGTIWTSAGISDYNTVVECEAHMLDFTASYDKIYVKAFLISNGNQKVELDLNEVGYVINTAPSVYAGTNKTAIYDVAVIPFSDGLFSDAEGNITKAEWKEEGGSYAEIVQGAYSSLLDAVQAFSVAFSHSGEKTIYLKITDSYDAYSEDNLVINVDRVNIDVTVKDSDGYSLSDVTFNPGDGSGSSTQNSPFSYTYKIGTHISIVSKNHYNSTSQSVTITIATTELNFIMSRETRLDEFIINVDAPIKYTLGDTFTLEGKINTDLTDYKIRCEINDKDGNSIKLATSNSGGSNSQIEIFNGAAGEFIVICAKDLTDNFKKNAIITIEIEDSNGQVRTIFEENIIFEDENLNWITP